MGKKERIIEGAKTLIEDLGDGTIATTIVSPIQSIAFSEEEDDYLLIIKDALGYQHFWNQDGTYDGWEASMK